MEGASIARIGPLHMTWSWLASGEKGAERLRRREQQARGSSTRQQCRVVEPMEGVLGRTSFAALTGGEESRPWQVQNVRSPTAVGRAPLDTGSGEPVTGTACDRERQRPRYSVVLSQPKGAEGNAANGLHTVHAVLRRMLSPKLEPEPPAPNPAQLWTGRLPRAYRLTLDQSVVAVAAQLGDLTVALKDKASLTT
jgi:hypothetical protein